MFVQWTSWIFRLRNLPLESTASRPESAKVSVSSMPFRGATADESFERAAVTLGKKSPAQPRNLRMGEKQGASAKKTQSRKSTTVMEAKSPGACDSC